MVSHVLYISEVVIVSQPFDWDSYFRCSVHILNTTKRFLLLIRGVLVKIILSMWKCPFPKLIDNNYSMFIILFPPFSLSLTLMERGNILGYIWQFTEAWCILQEAVITSKLRNSLRNLACCSRCTRIFGVLIQFFSSILQKFTIIILWFTRNECGRVNK
jgi:uncharacterized membrane protein